MHYVAMTKEEDKERDDQFNKLVDEEVEKQYGIRDEKKRREKEARRTLLQDVLQTRKEQVKYRGTRCLNY